MSSKLDLVKGIKELDPSWDIHRQADTFKEVDYLVGIVEFKQQLIKRFENEMKNAYEKYSTNYTGLSIGLEIVKNLKYKDNV